jgi:hypothetical protein
MALKWAAEILNSEFFLIHKEILQRRLGVTAVRELNFRLFFSRDIQESDHHSIGFQEEKSLICSSVNMYKCNAQHPHLHRAVELLLEK